MLAGERASTRDEPARGIYGSLSGIAARPGIIDAAVWIGYAWADEPRCSAAVVVTGTDEDVIQREARALAERYWNARTDFAFSVSAGDADWCIATGLAATARPYFISDSGDNPTAGGAGDVAYVLGRLLAHPDLAAGRATAISASVVDPVRWLAASPPERAQRLTSPSAGRSVRRRGEWSFEGRSVASSEATLSAVTSPSWRQAASVRSSPAAASRTTSFGIFRRSISIRPVTTSRS